MAKDWKPSPPKYPFDAEKPFHIPRGLGGNYCVSPSSVNVFDQCPAKFLWSKINKVVGSEQDTYSADTGIAVHEWAENIFARPHTIEQFEKIAELVGQKSLVDTYKCNLIAAEINYMEELDIEENTPYATEVKASSWGNHRVSYIDRVDFTPDGNLCVIDVKPADKRKYPANVRRQLHFYAAQLNYVIEQTEAHYQQLLNDENLTEEYALENAGRFSDLMGKRVTAMRVIGYKDASNWNMKFSKQTVTATEKRIEAMRSQTFFPCKIGNLCKYCEFADNICMEANMDLW